MTELEPKKKLNILLLFGGRSGEHEVSLLSAKSVYEALDKNNYNITLVGIDKNGHWKSGEESKLLLNSTDPKLIQLNDDTPEVATSAKGEKVTLKELESSKEITEVDVVLPIMHGTFGEDGTIQGFLELLNVAYVGSGVLGSAIGMDKDVTKRLLRDAGLPIGKFHVIRRHETRVFYTDIVEDLGGFPLFVKPANLGSSIGITKAHNSKELLSAIDTALEYDSKVLIEEYIPGREIEVAVLGNEKPKASVPGEIQPNHDFYSYDAKYLDEHGATLKIPAELAEDKVAEVQNLAIKTFEILECQGMARVDFFLTNTGEWFINEINTIPGFTKISMYPQLWETNGLSYSELLDSLIELAVNKKKEKDALKRDYK